MDENPFQDREYVCIIRLGQNWQIQRIGTINDGRFGKLEKIKFLKMFQEMLKLVEEILKIMSENQNFNFENVQRNQYRKF